MSDLNFSLWSVIPKPLSLEALMHERLLGHTALQSHKVARSHTQLTLQTLTWSHARDVSVRKAGPARSTGTFR